MLRKYKDAIVGGLVILAAVGLFAASLTIQSLSLNLIKADFFPKMVWLILLGILGIALLWDGLRKAGQASEESKGEEKSGMSQGTRCMIITLALIAVYIFCLEPIGFLLSTFVYLVIQMLVLADESHREKKQYPAVRDIVACCISRYLPSVHTCILPDAAKRIVGLKEASHVIFDRYRVCRGL